MSRGRTAARLALACACLAVSAPRAHAHAQPFSWVDVTLAGDSLRGSVTAHVEDLARETGDPEPDALLDPATLAARAPAVRAALARALDLRADGGRLAVRFGAPGPLPARRAVRVPWTARWPGGATLTLVGPLFTREAQHETYLDVFAGGALVHQDVVDAGHRASVWRTGERTSLVRVAARFVREGVRHIFAGPDHVLFVIGLLLLGGSPGRLAKIVTAFTVAHSITLALATLAIVRPSPRLVEPAIALSVVAVGVENLLARDAGRDRRAWLAFGFGFVHGFGFAGVLRELALPGGSLGVALASFNAGVEIGQVAIVLLVAPVVAWLHERRPRLAAPALTWGSATVIAAGAFWLVRRVLSAT